MAPRKKIQKPEKKCLSCDEKLIAREKCVVCKCCEKKYHIECVGIDRIQHLEIEVTKLWYCSKECELEKIISSEDGSGSESESGNNSPIEVKAYSSSSPDNLMAAIIDVQKSQQFISSQLDSFTKRCEFLEIENKNLRKIVNNQQNQSNYMKNKVNELERDLNKIKQSKCDDFAIISGVPNVNNENDDKIICKIGEVLGVTIKKDDIKSCKRISSNASKENADNYLVAEPILVEFSKNDEKKRELMKKQKSKGPVLTDQLEINIKNHPKDNKKIFIRDYLATNTMKLMNLAKQLKTEKNYKYIWFSTVTKTVLVRKGDNTKVNRIQCEDDICKLLSEDENAER